MSYRSLVTSHPLATRLNFRVQIRMGLFADSYSGQGVLQRGPHNTGPGSRGACPLEDAWNKENRQDCCGRWAAGA
jgi:hypothetical protein